MPQETAHYQSPVGALEIIATQCGIARVDFLEAAPVAKRAPASALMRECFAQLDGYFGGTRREFCLPLHEQTGTAFQRQVWAALRAIPVWPNAQLRADCRGSWAPPRGAGRGQCQRAQPAFYHHALPSRGARRGQTWRLRRRPVAQAAAARGRGYCFKNLGLAIHHITALATKGTKRSGAALVKSAKKLHKMAGGRCAPARQ